MNTTTIAGSPVVRASVVFPRVGAWTCAAQVAGVVTVGDRVAVVLDGVTLSGTVVRAADCIGYHETLIVAGAAGLGATTGPKSYRSAPARTVVTDILTDAGETLASSSTLPESWGAWVRLRSPGEEQLAAIAREGGHVWRALDDGTIWVGDETWSEAKFRGLVVEENHAAENAQTVTTDAPTIRPGQTVAGVRVERVEITVDSGSLRSTLTFATGDSPTLPGALARIMRRALPTPIDAQALYPAKVVEQHADGTLAVRPDSNRLPDLTHVPIRLGLPGVTVKVAAGARVLVGFEGQDLARPIATLWESDGLKEIHITASVSAEVSAPSVKIHGGTVTLVDGAQPIARKGDVVIIQTTSPPGLPSIGQIVTGQELAKA